jgi:hypothetical protein
MTTVFAQGSLLFAIVNNTFTGHGVITALFIVSCLLLLHIEERGGLSTEHERIRLEDCHSADCPPKRLSLEQSTLVPEKPITAVQLHVSRDQLVHSRIFTLVLPVVASIPTLPHPPSSTLIHQVALAPFMASLPSSPLHLSASSPESPSSLSANPE